MLIFAAFLNYLSLSRMPLYINNTLINLLFVFVFVSSILFLGERVRLWKVVGSLIIFGGLGAVCAGTIDSSSSASSSVWGYLFLGGTIVLSTAYYLLWAKLMLPHSVHSPMSLSIMGMGFIGLSVCCLGENQQLLFFFFLQRRRTLTRYSGWIGLLIANYSGLEKFSIPQGAARTRVLINMGLDMPINIANLAGALFVSATFVTVGGLFQIPISLAAQSVLLAGGAQVNAAQIVGVVLVALGVLCFELTEVVIQWIQRKWSETKRAVN